MGAAAAEGVTVVVFPAHLLILKYIYSNSDAIYIYYFIFYILFFSYYLIVILMYIVIFILSFGISVTAILLLTDSEFSLFFALLI